MDSVTEKLDPGDSGAGFPRQFGDYTVLREFGRGGQGVVYLAMDTRSQEKIALKVLLGRARLDRSSQERFRREARTLGEIDHPGICRVHEVGKVDESPFIAMQFIEGETLTRFIGRAKDASIADDSVLFVDLEESQEIDTPDPSPSTRTVDARGIKKIIACIEEVAEALHAAHQAGFVHRDIKPDNIMLTDEGRPVICDFGMVRDQSAEADSLTIVGTLVGTIHYMSPEQLLAQHVTIDHRTDIYSLGTTLFECLSLSRPFEGDTREELLAAINSKAPRRLSDLNPIVPASLVAIVEKATARDRDERYASAQELADALRAVRMNYPGPLRIAVGRVLRTTVSIPLSLLRFLGSAGPLRVLWRLIRIPVYVLLVIGLLGLGALMFQADGRLDRRSLEQAVQDLQAYFRRNTIAPLSDSTIETVGRLIREEQWENLYEFLDTLRDELSADSQGRARINLELGQKLEMVVKRAADPLWNNRLRREQVFGKLWKIRDCAQRTQSPWEGRVEELVFLIHQYDETLDSLVFERDWQVYGRVVRTKVRRAESLIRDRGHSSDWVSTIIKERFDLKVGGLSLYVRGFLLYGNETDQEKLARKLEILVNDVGAVNLEMVLVEQFELLDSQGVRPGKNVIQVIRKFLKRENRERLGI